jgi:hypothetical protein
LRAGRVFISRDVDGPQLYLQPGAVRAVDARGAALLLISDRGIEQTATVDSDDWTASVSVRDAAYARAQLMDGYGQLLALSNPVFL